MGEGESLAHDDSLPVLVLDIDDDLAPGALGFDGGMGIRAAVESVKTKGSIRGLAVSQSSALGQGSSADRRKTRRLRRERAKFLSVNDFMMRSPLAKRETSRRR